MYYNFSNYSNREERIIDISEDKIKIISSNKNYNNKIFRKYKLLGNEECDVFITDEQKNVSINVSGGADSTILLYVITKIIKENNLPIKIYPITINMYTRHNLITAPVVIKMIEERLDYKFEEHLILDFGNMDNGWASRYKVEYSNVRQKYNVSVSYEGISSMPGWPNPMPEETKVGIEEKHLKTVIERNVSLEERINQKGFINTFISKPFWFKDKSFIASLFDFYNVMDLLPYTRSCSMLADNTEDYKYTCFTSPKQMQCWWCTERKWAFEKYPNANYKDFYKNGIIS